RSQAPKSEDIDSSRQMRENIMKPIPPNQYYMKKSQPEMVRDDSNNNPSGNNNNNNNKNNTDQSRYEAHPINQNPNYIMASPHDANSPGVITSRLDQSNGGLFSSIYYIGDLFPSC
ncbi:unnamed protein product, partial [Allacma fusca]